MDWAKLAVAIPELAAAILFAVFALALLKLVIDWMERRDKVWHELLADERQQSGKVLIGLTHEIQMLVAMTNSVRELIVRHDEWERASADSAIAATDRNTVAIRDLANTSGD